MPDHSSYWQEDRNAADAYRRQYIDDLSALIAERQKAGAARRDAFMQGYPQNIDIKRGQFKRMLGWPLTERFDKPPEAAGTRLGEDDEALIDRLCVEVMPGLRIGGVLLRQKDGAKRPLIIAQHGGSGTPELIAGLYDGGNTYNYNDMARRVFRRGAHVFAPQLLLWNKEWHPVPYDRVEIDKSLKQLGSSITAVEVFCVMRCLDYLVSQPFVDAQRVGMVGLSYGGFYTLFTAAADTRIRSCVASGFFNDRLRYNWPDWTWYDAANTFLDAEVGALVAPRGLHLQLGMSDNLFDERPAREEYQRLSRYYHLAGCADRLSMEFFVGDHEFSRSDETLDALFADLA